MNDLSLGNLKVRFAKVGQFFAKHYRMIYFVVSVCVVIGAMIGLNLALYQPSDEDYRAQRLSEVQSARFDTETIKKIQNLNARQQTNTDALPSGQRTNPFGE
jgi:Flp pilus assembly protein TadB